MKIKKINFKVFRRIAQMVVAPVQKVSFIKKINLTPTKRGAGGFGSTGK